jgi:methylene-tetrahydromethanopterin dehydrogenase
VSEKKFVLHFLTPLKNVSPFDVNMAADAGFDVIVPYTDVDLKEVAGLVQDAIFSRAPQDGKRTAVLIGGRDPLLAVDMLDAAQEGDDPAALRDLGHGRPLGRVHDRGRDGGGGGEAPEGQGQGLAGARVAVYGATGPVGGVAGLIAAKAGAEVTLVGYDGLQRVTPAATSSASGSAWRSGRPTAATRPRTPPSRPGPR